MLFHIIFLFCASLHFQIFYKYIKIHSLIVARSYHFCALCILIFLFHSYLYISPFIIFFSFLLSILQLFDISPFPFCSSLFPLHITSFSLVRFTSPLLFIISIQFVSLLRKLLLLRYIIYIFFLCIVS